MTTNAAPTWNDIMSRPHLRESDLRAIAASLKADGDHARARYRTRLADDIAARLTRSR